MAVFSRTRQLRALRRAEQGSVAVELALFIPVMLLLLAGLFQFGSGIFDSLRLESAARAGAQYAMIDPTNATSIQNAVLDAIGGDTTDVEVTATSYCQCPGDNTHVDCTIVSCSGGASSHQFVSIAANRPFTSILSLPALGSLTEVSGHAIIRVR
jgi:Flp pilus assembly protein TadG